MGSGINLNFFFVFRLQFFSDYYVNIYYCYNLSHKGATKEMRTRKNDTDTHIFLRITTIKVLEKTWIPALLRR